MLISQPSLYKKDLEYYEKIWNIKQENMII